MTQLRGNIQNQRLQLTDLIPLETLQKLQDGFVESYGIPLIICGKDGTPITHSINITEFCRTIRSSEKGKTNCQKPNC